MVAVSLAVLLGVVVDASAAPLDLKRVSADATWLGHVDIDAVRESIVVQKAMEKHKHSIHKEFVKKMLGMDPDKDLHGMTFYGKEIGKHKGVMILHAKVDRGRVMGMARMFTKPTVTDYRGHKLHSWTHKSRHSSKTHNVAAVFYGEESIVLASSVDELKQAVDVLEGKAPSLTTDSSLAGNIPTGTTLLMRVEGVSDVTLPEKCKVAKQIKSFRFVTGEHDGESFYRARATTTNAELAGQLKEIIEGFRAVGQIHLGNTKTEKKLVDAIKVKADDTTLTVLWSAPAEDVWTVVTAIEKIVEEKMKKHRQQHASDRHHDSRRHGWWHRGGHEWHHGGHKKEEPGKKEVPSEEDF